ncbi:MAG TPA: amino acid adenylation domain-containing protein, partial [Micromonosporaceae bacterium]
DELAHAAAHPDVPWPHVRDLLAEPLTAAVAVYDGGYGAVREPIAGVSLAVEIDRAEIAVRYDAARWHPATVAALTSRIVAESTAPDDRALTDAVRIDNATRAIVVGWGDGRTTAQISPATVPHLIAAAARSTPQAIAVDGPDGLLTYAALIERATSLSSWLRDRGVGVEDRVALCVPRGTAMVWAALGVLMAGAAYVPVDAHWPEQRKDHVLSDARIRAVVTVADHRSLFGQADVVCTIDEVTAPAGAIPVEIAAGLTERCAAYVIYTSGSTGAPKGVVVEHRSVVNFVRQIAEAYAIDAQTRLLGFAALTFDLHVFDIWTALGCGATLVLAGDAERQSADALQRLLRDKRVTAAELPPSLMPLLAPEDLPTLRLVSVGGEAPAATLVDTWATPARQMWNGYGPTETTVAVTLMRCEAPSGGRTPPIGRPMPNHRAYVLDEGLRLVAPGVPGELCIAGIGVARGYVGAPGATATRFVPDPYSNVAGARLYRTGDLVRWTGDGLLEFLGRVDRQVKIRGFRIELGEVEAALNEDERVRQAVVDIHDDATGTRHLVAYVVPADRAEAIDLGAVRDMAGRRLPEYMLPTRLAVLDKLPVTAHGKLDRRRLAALARAGVSVLLDNSSAAGGSDASASVGPDASASAGSGGDDPDTPTERAIVADIFAPLLGLAGIGSGDDFFRLGGSSLQAMQVTARVRDRFAVEVGLADFFVEPTARRLARLVEAAIRRREEEQSDLYGGSPRPTEAVASAGGDIDRPTGLSYPQLRMWQLNEREPGHPSHHAPLALRLTGALDFAALRQAISRIVQRHAPLRSRFTATGQTFAAYATVPVDVVDVRESEIARLVREESERPFDLVNGPMIRVTLFRIADDDHVLQWNVHHIVTDAWSIGVMLGELFTLYNGCRDGSAPELPALPAHYRDFVEWQRAFVASPAYAEQLTWWRSHLSGIVTDSRLPTDAPRGGRFRLGWRNTRLSADETKAAIEIGRRHGVTLFMATLACWSLALAADADFDDLVVAVPLAGRKRTEWEPLVGYFVNRVLIRVPLERGLTFADLLDQVRAETAAAFAHQDVPFESLIRELGVPLSAISVNFSIQNAPQGSAGLGGLRIGPVIDDSGRDFAPIMELYSPVGARFEASMVLRQRADGLAGGLEYDASLFSAQRAEGWARRFGLLLVTAASEPHVALNEFRDMARSVSVPAMR